MAHDLDVNRIERIAALIAVLWKEYPALRLGQLLEVVSGKSPKVVLMTERDNLMAGESKVVNFPVDMYNVTDKEWEERLRGIINAGGF
jgi:hypothetical protein